ncbi:MAG: hypothetical protein ACI9FN_003262 [Saprospiraceae bacterium]|jgi:hypothetical protein
MIIGNRNPLIQCFLAITLLIFVFACGDGLLRIQISNSDGLLEQEYMIDIDSLKQGFLISYHSNGADVFEKAEYLDDRLHGTRTLYYNSGQPEIVENYLQDILTDTLYLYYESGAIKMKSYFEMGVHSGINISYYENGKIKEEVLFAENMEQGPFTEYHENGELSWTGQYLNGDNEFGELTQFDVKGVMIKKMICDSLGICATIWTIEKGDIAPAYVRTSN